MKTSRHDLKLSDPLHDYLQYPSTRHAVDALLAHELEHLAVGMQWDELINHCNTLILAHQIRNDYLEVLLKASKRIWKPLIKGTIWRELTIGELAPEQQPSPQNVWTQGLFRCFINRDNGQPLTTLLSLHQGEGLVASFSVAPRDVQDIPPGWEIDGHDSRYWRTQPGLAEYHHSSLLDISSLVGLAETATIALSQAELEPS